MTQGSWKDYFPFESEEAVKIEAKILLFSLKGTGTVRRCSDSELDLTISIPEQSILGKSIPAIDASIAISYSEEGSANTAVIEYKGRRKEDKALAITSNPNEQCRRIEPSVAIGGKTIAFTLVRTGKRAAEIHDVTGLNLPFDLKLKIKPA